MGHPKSKHFLMQVVCDACAAMYDPECIICRGEKYYWWDTQSHLCFISSGEPMTYRNLLGEITQVRREPPSVTTAPAHITIEDMLAFIEVWTMQHQASRKFKLSFAEEWTSTVWLNRYTEKGISFSSIDLKECIRTCYSYLLSLPPLVY